MTKIRVADFLSIGMENARTGQQLADLLHCRLRDITRQIERERVQGIPIIASTSHDHPGYYLADTAEELQIYCRRLFHRAGEIHKTRAALLAAARTMRTN